MWMSAKCVAAAAFRAAGCMKTLAGARAINAAQGAAISSSGEQILTEILCMHAFGLSHVSSNGCIAFQLRSASLVVLCRKIHRSSARRARIAVTMMVESIDAMLRSRGIRMVNFSFHLAFQLQGHAQQEQASPCGIPISSSPAAVLRARPQPRCWRATASASSWSIRIPSIRPISAAKSSTVRRSACCAAPGSPTRCCVPARSTANAGSRASVM